MQFSLKSLTMTVTGAAMLCGWYYWFVDYDSLVFGISGSLYDDKHELLSSLLGFCIRMAGMFGGGILGVWMLTSLLRDGDDEEEVEDEWIFDEEDRAIFDEIPQYCRRFPFREEDVRSAAKDAGVLDEDIDFIVDSYRNLHMIVH